MDLVMRGMKQNLNLLEVRQMIRYVIALLFLAGLQKIVRDDGTM